MLKCFAAIAVLLPLLPGSALGQAAQRPLASGWRILVERAKPVLATGALATSAKAPTPAASLTGHAMSGTASYYWQGQMTSSGERFDGQALTAAHRTLPMNTRVKVTHVQSGRSVVVRINDRGPFKPGRVVDVSDRAAEILGFKARGIAPVRLEVVP